MMMMAMFQFAMSGANRSLPPQNLSDQSKGGGICWGLRFSFYILWVIGSRY